MRGGKFHGWYKKRSFPTWDSSWTINIFCLVPTGQKPSKIFRGTLFQIQTMASPASRCQMARLLTNSVPFCRKTLLIMLLEWMVGLGIYNGMLEGSVNVGLGFAFVRQYYFLDLRKGILVFFIWKRLWWVLKWGNF